MVKTKFTNKVIFFIPFWLIFKKCITSALRAKRGKRDILPEARDEGIRKIKCLLPVHCSGSPHVHYMNVILMRFWHVIKDVNIVHRGVR